MKKKKLTAPDFPVSARFQLTKSLSSLNAVDSELHDSAPDAFRRAVGVSKAVQRFKFVLTIVLSADHRYKGVS